MYKYNFLKYSVPSVLFTLIIIGAGIASYFIHDGFRYSVDFSGGTEMRVQFEKPVNLEAIKAVIHDQWQGTVYSIIGAPEIIVRVQEMPEKNRWIR